MENVKIVPSLGIWFIFDIVDSCPDKAILLKVNRKTEKD